jgi:hypothetical protein
MRSLLIVGTALFAIAIATGPFMRAQVKIPKPPDAYDVQLRYKIQADRNERVLQFEAMTKFFGSLGFKETETEESDLAPFDPNAEFMAGTIPSKNARDLLRDRRVKTILLSRPGYKAPDNAQDPIRVQIELAPNRDQLALANQVEIAVGTLGFKRDIGFDTRNFTILRGTMPSGNVPKLLRDLRYQPSGWFLPETPAELYVKLPDGTPTPNLVRPFADGVPVRVVEILGPVEAPPAIVALPPIPADQPHLEKWTADLRRKLAEEGAADKPLRLEVVVAITPQEGDLEWRRPFVQVGAQIEGRTGPVVTVLVPKGSQAAAVAALADVTAVRLPRVASVPTREEPKKAPPKDEKIQQTGGQQDPKAADVLKRTRLDQLHAMGHRGQGMRVVVLDSDFAGWEKLAPRDAKGSGKVTFIDLSTDRNRDARPDPMPGDLGHGTQAASAVRLAAPAADLTLVRIPPDAPYHVFNVARYVRGDTFRTEGLITRRLEIEAEIDVLRVKQRDALGEYRKAFDDFSDEDAARQRRIKAQQALRQLATEERAILARLERVEALEESLAGLAGAHIVVSMLHWNTGFAQDGASGLSQFLDDWLTRTSSSHIRHLTVPNPKGPPLWFQPAGDTRGQTWTGLFRDADNNGVMEFATADADLKPGRWSRELNFLSTWANGKESLDLSGGAKVRISVQWREPHDPALSEADYRVAVAPIKLQLVKQRDPTGEKYASDEIDLIAASEGLPSRLYIEPNFAVYEHTLELTLPADGRYAVRLEGAVPNRIRPPGVPTLQTQQVTWELRPRLLVESADGQGRFLLADYASANGGVAVPGDARSVFAVGTASTTSAAGAGPGVALRTKPDLIGPATLPGIDRSGTDIAAAFSAGFAATLGSAGMRAASFPHRLGIEPGGELIVPEGWFGK